MSETLKNFLVDLACEVWRSTQYEKLARWKELTEEEKEAIKTGDTEKIRQLLGPLPPGPGPVFQIPVFFFKAPPKKKPGR
jgi:hypothetical protein